MLEFGVDQYLVEIRVALKYFGIVGIHQRSEMGARIMLAQSRQERCGAYQIADIVTADYQDTGWRHPIFPLPD